MLTQLSVVNDCLAIMGETPLNTLSEDHEYKAAAMQKLESESNRIQSTGWWFNMEHLTLSVNPLDGRVYLPNDAGSVLILTSRPGVVQRGRILYDLDNGTDKFVDGATFVARLIRVLAIELVPQSVAEYISVSAVLAFQNLYDGDQTKTRNLAAVLQERRVEAMAEHIRNRKVNLLDRSIPLARIRNVVRQLRR